MTQTPAGWFPDPEQPGQLRYWDGGAWTEHRAPAQPSAHYPGPATGGLAPAGARPAGVGLGARRHGGLWWKVALGVVGFFFLIGIIGAIVGSSSGSQTTATTSDTTDQTSSAATSPGPTQASSPAPKPKSVPKPRAQVGTEENPAPRGTTVANKSAAYEVLGVSVTNSLGGFAQPPAGRYVVVDLAVMNVKKSTIQVNMNDFKLEVNGVEIDPSSQAFTVDNAFTYDDISPGLAKRGKVVFDVAPKDAGHGVLKAQAYVSLDSPVYLSLR